MELRGLHDFHAFVQRVAKLDERDLLDELGAVLLAETLKNFEEERDPDGKAWESLKDSTLRQKRGGKILQDSRAMLRSIEARRSGTTLEVGTPLEYGQWHQEGTRRMEARPFAGFGRSSKDVIGQAVTRHFEEMVP